MNEIERVLKDSYIKYIENGGRSNEKLKVLHGYIAQKISAKMGREYNIDSINLTDGKEKNIEGKYYKKRVDIAISKNNEIVAGVAVKFVMSNYNQNVNNYFENMLGETANIRSNNIPYFQIFIVFTRMPYFKDDGTIGKIEELSDSDKLEKYNKLSIEDVDKMLHSPNIILIYTVDLDDFDFESCIDKEKEEFKNIIIQQKDSIKIKEVVLNDVNETKIIYNDIDTFIDKIYNKIKSEE